MSVRSGLWLRGGWLVDGTGAPPFRADLLVRGEQIAAVRPAGSPASSNADANSNSSSHDTTDDAAELDVTGRFVMPGFIDAHAHLDALVDDPAIWRANLRQGVTTVVLGQDGVSFAPTEAAALDRVSRYFAAVNGHLGNPPNAAKAGSATAGGWSVADLLEHWDGAGPLNTAYLIPAGTVRSQVLGDDDRPASAGELRAMRRLVEQGREQGAVGLSSGLEYVPGRSADVTELAALARSAGGVHASHLRGYEAAAAPALAELLAVYRASEVPIHVSHLHGPAHMLVGILDAARADGVDLTFDSYPYLRGATILAMVALPPGFAAGGVDRTLARLADPKAATVIADWAARPGVPPLAEVTLAHAADPAWAWAEGLTLAETAQRATLPPAELARRLLLDTGLEVSCLTAQPATNTDADLRMLLRHEAQLAGSDAVHLGGRPHPRGYGAFARLLGRHVRELGDWTWGQAGVHLSSHAARRFGLGARGLVREGFVADLVIVDPTLVADRATYGAPRALAVGIDDVLVAGQWVLRHGELTGALPGRAIRG